VIFSRVCGMLPRLTCWPRLIQAGFSLVPAPLLHTTDRALADGRQKPKGISKKAVIAPTLNLTTVLGRMVKYIETENIEINRYAVENDKVFPIPSSMLSIPRRNFTNYPSRPKLPDIIKTGRFNREEDGIILKNWKELLEDTRFRSQEEEVKAVLFDNTDKADDIKVSKKVIGCWLSQGLKKTRLPSDVFHRAKILLCSVQGEFSEQDKQLIIAFVTEHGREWAELSRITGRRPDDLRSTYNMTLSHGDKMQSGAFSLVESKEVMRQVFAACPTVLTGGEVGGPDREVFTKLGTKLDRKPHYVYNHWKLIIEPVLTRHQAGTLDVDYKDRIIRYMVNNGLKYVLDVKWGEVANLPEFRGTTGFFLQKEYNCMLVDTQYRHPDMKHKDISSDLVLDWHENKKYHGKSKNKIEKEEAIIKKYLEISKYTS